MNSSDLKKDLEHVESRFHSWKRVAAHYFKQRKKAYEVIDELLNDEKLNLSDEQLEKMKKVLSDDDLPQNEPTLRNLADHSECDGEGCENCFDTGYDVDPIIEEYGKLYYDIDDLVDKFSCLSKDSIEDLKSYIDTRVIFSEFIGRKRR